MNRSYKTVWNEALGAWVATSEINRSKGKGKNTVKRVVSAGVLTVAGVLGASGTNAYAQGSFTCEAQAVDGSGNAQSGYAVVSNNMSVVTANAVACADPYDTTGSPFASIGVGNSPQGLSTGIYFDGSGAHLVEPGALLNFTASGNNVLMTGVAAGGISATSVDAINGSQLYSLSTSVSTSIAGRRNGRWYLAVDKFEHSR